jgi:hypothetical protein
VLRQHDNPPPGVVHEVAKAVVIAGLSAAVTGGVTWAYEALKARFGPKKDVDAT